LNPEKSQDRPMYFYLSKHSRWLMVPILLWLSACATQVPVDERLQQDHWQANRDKIMQLDQWQLKGRIAVTMRRQAWSASLQWVQQRQNYHINIIAPLGQGSVSLEGNDRGVSMRLAKDRVLQADAPETLLRKNLGWSAPVSGLIYWIRGIPVPGKRIKKLSLDTEGRVIQMEQSGWQVSYSGYSSQGGINLPGKIDLVNGGLRLRLVIRNWLI
jgi:outer membrane lipoprotein LolB